MNIIKSIADELYLNIDNQTYKHEPFYFDKIRKVFAFEVQLKTLLKSELIQSKDDTFRLFIDVLVKHNHLDLNKATIANVCSGSELLNRKIERELLISKDRIFNFDNSENMLDDENKYAVVDFSVENEFTHKFDMIISLGSLRYFCTTMNFFAKNISGISKENCYIQISDIHESVIFDFGKKMEEIGFSGTIMKTEGRVFKNTLFYLLLYKYKFDNSFKFIVDQNVNPNNGPYELLIEAAGFRNVSYYHFIYKN